MSENLSKTLNESSSEDLAGFVLTQACSELVDKETDVIEVVSKCVKLLDIINEDSKGAATKLFNVLETIIEHLKEVAEDGGLLTIELDKAK